MRCQLSPTLNAVILVAVLILLAVTPFLLVPEDARSKGLYLAVFNPFGDRNAHYAALHEAEASLLSRGYKGVYLVGGEPFETLPARLREHGALLVLPPTLGLGCDFGALDRVE